MYVSRKLPFVFIFNEVTWFFPSNVYLCELINRAIHTHGVDMDMDECLSRTFFS
jgi:hypothetical protein